MKRGFTLIEIIVVTAVLGVIMVSVTGILVNSFKSKNITNTQQLVDESGTFVITEIRRRVLPATALNTITDGFSFEELGVTVPVTCSGGVITMGSSALSTGTTVSCASFATINSKILTIGFTLSVGSSVAGPDNFSQKSFQTEMVMRN